MPRRLGIVEVALFIALQAHRELMKVLGDLMVAVEAFIEIDFAIGVQVMQARELIATSDIDLVLDESSGPTAETAPMPCASKLMLTYC